MVFRELASVFVSAVFWLAFYCASRLCLPKRNPEYCSRITALLHGIIMIVVGINQCFVGDSIYKVDPSTKLQEITMIASLGYFIEDLTWCLYTREETKLMIAHHIFSCVSLLRVILRGESGRQACCGLGCLEVTNPFLQARWYIRTHGLSPTLFMAVETLFVIMFFLVRGGIGSVYAFRLLFFEKATLEFKMYVVIIYAISVMFMINMGKYVIHKYTLSEPRPNEMENLDAS